MKKILGLTVAALLVMGLVGGGTWAYFSDVETTTGNALAAGTLDLETSASVVFDLDTKAPGDNATTEYNTPETLTLTPAGTLSGELDISFSAITNTESIGSTQYEADVIGDAGVGELGGEAEIAVWVDMDQDGVIEVTDLGLNSTPGTYDPSTGLVWATIDSYDSDSWDSVIGSMSSAVDFVVEWRIPWTTGNTIQGDEVSFDITFTLEQSGVD